MHSKYLNLHYNTKFFPPNFLPRGKSFKETDTTGKIWNTIFPNKIHRAWKHSAA